MFIVIRIKTRSIRVRKFEHPAIVRGMPELFEEGCYVTECSVPLELVPFATSIFASECRKILVNVELLRVEGGIRLDQDGFPDHLLHLLQPAG